MRALHCLSLGRPSELQLVDIPDLPQPKAGEVKVKAISASAPSFEATKRASAVNAMQARQAAWVRMVRMAKYGRRRRRRAAACGELIRVGRQLPQAESFLQPVDTP